MRECQEGARTERREMPLTLQRQRLDDQLEQIDVKG